MESIQSWPPVPAYVRLFRQEEEGDAEEKGEKKEEKKRPPRYAEPPPPRPLGEEEAYSVFAIPCQLKAPLPTLEGSGIPDLGSSLQTLVRSVLVTYLELVRGTVQGQNQDPRLDAIRTMLINMQFLVNQHRPQQAYDTVKNIMRAELERKRALIAELDAACDQAEQLLDHEGPQKRSKTE